MISAQEARRKAKAKLADTTELQKHITKAADDGKFSVNVKEVSEDQETILKQAGFKVQARRERGDVVGFVISWKEGGNA